MGQRDLIQNWPGLCGLRQPILLDLGLGGPSGRSLPVKSVQGSRLRGRA